MYNLKHVQTSSLRLLHGGSLAMGVCYCKEWKQLRLSRDSRGWPMMRTWKDFVVLRLYNDFGLNFDFVVWKHGLTVDMSHSALLSDGAFGIVIGTPLLHSNGLQAYSIRNLIRN